jgi:hypothetical protein
VVYPIIKIGFLWLSTVSHGGFPSWKTTASATEPELQPVAKPAGFASVENGGDIDVPFFLLYLTSNH